VPVVLPTRLVEDHLFASGATAVIGSDEVGRGSVAGPVGVGMTLVRPGFIDPPAGVRDSKALSQKKREELAPAVLVWAPHSAVGFASADEIDSFGITVALRMAGMRALEQLAAQTDLTGAVILLDGSQNWLAGADLPCRVVMREKADRDCMSVAAASVLAKVERDNLMIALGDEHPAYGFAGHKGYGAKTHYEAIRAHGTIPGVHRVTWIR
jgi:ribonuclease HII